MGGQGVCLSFAAGVVSFTMFDVLIAGGRLVDGTGNPWCGGDVGIVGDGVAAIGRLDGAAARVTIDAAGLVVAPGFIDTHVHCDLQLLHEPQHQAAIRQGVTTEVLAQDGRSCAPLTQRNREWARQHDRWSPPAEPLGWDWASMAEFRARCDRTVAVNTVHLVGYETLCRAVMGSAGQVAAPDELAAMQRLVVQCLEQGARGLSTQLAGSEPWDTDQLIALCRPMAPYSGVYVTHRRNAYEPARFGGVREAIQIAEQAGVGGHISHLKSGHGELETRGRAAEILALLDEARARGVDMTAESYPYLAGSSGLSSLLPQWAARGAPLDDPHVRRRIKKEVARRHDVPMDGKTRGWPDFAASFLAAIYGPRYRRLAGRSIAEAAAQHGLDPVELVCDLLIADHSRTTIVHFDSSDPAVQEILEQDMRTIMRWPAHMVGSDSSDVGDVPHPRAYGTFPRFLGVYCRELGLFRLEELVRKMTSLPAQRFGLADRGLLRPGMAADIVVFDPDTITDRATYQQPRQFPVGIEHVLVNGQIALRGGETTGVVAGRPLP